MVIIQLKVFSLQYMTTRVSTNRTEDYDQEGRRRRSTVAVVPCGGGSNDHVTLGVWNQTSGGLGEQPLPP